MPPTESSELALVTEVSQRALADYARVGGISLAELVRGPYCPELSALVRHYLLIEGVDNDMQAYFWPRGAHFHVRTRNGTGIVADLTWRQFLPRSRSDLLFPATPMVVPYQRIPQELQRLGVPPRRHPIWTKAEPNELKWWHLHNPILEKLIGET